MVSPALPLQRSGCLWECSLEKGQWACKSQGMNIYLPSCYNASLLNMYFFYGRQYPTVLWESCHFKAIFPPYFLLSWWFHRCGTFFFFFFSLENPFHINMFISVNLFNWRASPLQLVNNASINHNQAQFIQRLILSNSVYKICFKTHIYLGIYLGIWNTQQSFAVIDF